MAGQLRRDTLERLVIGLGCEGAYLTSQWLENERIFETEEGANVGCAREAEIESVLRS